MLYLFSKGGGVLRILSYTVTKTDDGRKLKSILRGNMAISYGLLQSLKWRQGAILLNGEPCTVVQVVRAGDIVTVNVEDSAPVSEHITPVDYPLDILWEDADLLILNKPAGMAVHAAALTEETVTVAGAVTHYLGGSAFHPVNRLDKGVTGIMVIAKNGHAHDLCMRILHTEAFRREYRGICEGVPSPAKGTIDLPIGREEGSAIRRCIDEKGLESYSEYELLTTSGERSLLRLRPLTGRTHQLRVHCAAIGHPLVGDWLYGTEDKTLISRPALHSYELWLTHPITGESIHLVAPLPADMERLL